METQRGPLQFLEVLHVAFLLTFKQTSVGHVPTSWVQASRLGGVRLEKIRVFRF